MAVTTVSSRDFNQDVSGVKKAASKGPVFITDRGRPAHVLLTVEDYYRLTQKGGSLLASLEQRGPKADFDFDPPRLEGSFPLADLE